MQEAAQNPMMDLINKIEDPLQRQLLQNLLSSQQQNKKNSTPNISIEKAKSDVRKLMATCKYQQTQLEELDEQLHLQQNILSTAAKALGACSCLGLYSQCNQCGGKGKPGTYEIDESSFNALVLPLLSRLKEKIDDQAVNNTKINGTNNEINNN